MFNQNGRYSIINLGTALGLMVGLGVGMMGALAWNLELTKFVPPSQGPRSGSTAPPSSTDKALTEFAALSIERSAFLSELLRGTRIGVVPGGVDSLIQQNATETERVVQVLKGRAAAPRFTQALNRQVDALVSYAENVRDKKSEAAEDVLATLPSIADAAAQALSTSGATSTAIRSLFSQEHALLKRLVDISVVGASAESYRTQRQIDRLLMALPSQMMTVG